jgi:hypothetical protein
METDFCYESCLLYVDSSPRRFVLLKINKLSIGLVLVILIQVIIFYTKNVMRDSRVS